MGHQIRTKSPLDDRQFLADVAVAMAQVPLLSGLNAVQHERLARRGRLDYHEPRTKIFVQNTRGDDIIVVLDGEVTLIRQEPDRTTRVISTKAPGSSFGEIGFVTGSPRTLTAIAGRRGALVLKISRAEFENGTRDDPSIGLAVFRELLETIQQRMHGLPPFFRNYLLWGYRTPALETGASESFKPLSKVLLMAVAGRSHHRWSTTPTSSRCSRSTRWCGGRNEDSGHLRKRVWRRSQRRRVPLSIHEG